MGLLDEVLGAAMRGGQQQGQGGGGGLGDLLGGLLGGGQQGAPGGGGVTDLGGLTGRQADQAGGLGGVLGGMLSGGAGGAGLGGLASVLGSLLGNDGGQGGLGGILSKFNQAGLGDKANSWVGSGQNEAINADQVNDALGHDTVADVGSKLGVPAGAAGGLLAAILPMLIDRLTPHGQAPAQGLGTQDDVLGQLTGMLRNR